MDGMSTTTFFAASGKEMKACMYEIFGTVLFGTVLLNPFCQESYTCKSIFLQMSSVDGMIE
jgi:hypothetical protein